MQKRKAGKLLSLGLGLKKKVVPASEQTPPQQSEKNFFECRTVENSISKKQKYAESLVSKRPETVAKSRPSIFAADEEYSDDSRDGGDDGRSSVEGNSKHKGESDQQKSSKLSSNSKNGAAEDSGDGKKKRNLDLFLEELKRGQEMREQKQQLRKAKRIERSGQKSYSSDAQGDALHGQQQLQYGEQRQTATNSSINDGETTNLYVTNIHTDVDEQALCMAFAKYGPIASVKIMWPRTPEEFARQRNSGFVSFMDRKTAASALSGMDGHLLNDLALRVCWGKRISIPPKPVFVLDSSNPGRLPPTGHPFNAKRPTNGSNEDNIPEVHVERPLDHRLVRLIHWTIEHVIKNGPEFECLLIYRKADDPRFSFLTDYESPEHVYYRWRMYSLLNGDTKLKWRDLMFFMYDEGPVWVPPKPETFGANNAGDGLLDNTGMNNISSSEAEEEAERNHGAVQPDKLGTRARDRLERRVRRVRNAKRGTIAEAMTFAIDHAYAATDVVDVICRALLDPETPFSEKLFKLMLISDILHNCSAPVANAWRLRQTFEERLDQIFKHLATVFRAIDARLKAEHFRKVVLSVLAVWEAWMMFPEKNIHKLAAYFL